MSHVSLSQKCWAVWHLLSSQEVCLSPLVVSRGRWGQRESDLCQKWEVTGNVLWRGWIGVDSLQNFARMSDLQPLITAPNGGLSVLRLACGSSQKPSKVLCQTTPGTEAQLVFEFCQATNAVNWDLATFWSFSDCRCLEPRPIKVLLDNECLELRTSKVLSLSDYQCCELKLSKVLNFVKLTVMWSETQQTTSAVNWDSARF